MSVNIPEEGLPPEGREVESLEADETIAPRPEEEIADATRADDGADARLGTELPEDAATHEG